MQKILLVQMFFRITRKSRRRFWEILSGLKFERAPGNIPEEYSQKKTNCKKQKNKKKKKKKKNPLLSNSFEENIFHTSICH